jgi:hypothetical protein
MARKNPVEPIAAKVIEEHLEKIARGSTPWVAWLVGIPVIATAFRLLALATDQIEVLSRSMLGAAAVLTAVVWSISHQKGFGRIHHALNAGAALGWVAADVAWGPGADRGMMLITYAVGGLLACLLWNVRYTPHTGGVEDVIRQVRKDLAGKRFDGAYLIRVLAHHAPLVRDVAETAGKVFPGAVAPFREAPKAIANGPGQPAVAAAPAGPSPADMKQAAETAQRLLAAWRDLATDKVPALAGSRMKILDIKPWRVRTVIVLKKGVQEPKAVIDNAGLFASNAALPLSAILARPNRKRHDQALLDVVLKNVLDKRIIWPGPAAPGQSITAEACPIGVYEDGRVATRYGPAISSAMAAKLGREPKNLSHLLYEGMNGAGKSTTARIQITDAATRLDVEEWLIDTVKKYQTFGPLGEAFDWFATTKNEAIAQIRFLAEVIIPERAEYLGLRGYDNWVAGCGLPYLRVTIEEGGVISNELEKLDDVVSTARSVGVEISLSVQRAHHENLDTNVRAQFPETLTFGVKNIDDVFALPEELLDAGADPAQWQNKQPGMAYWAASDLPLDDQIMPMRGYDQDVSVLAGIVNEHVPARRAWIEENCPDWTEMLQRIDPNGVYANRTTGAAVAAKMAAAEARRTGRQQPMQAVVMQPADVQGADDEYARPAAALTDPAPAGPGQDESDLERPVTLDELDITDKDLRDGIAEDEGIDPALPILAVDGDDFVFPPRPGGGRTREDAMRLLRSYLMHKGVGWEFGPAEIYNDEAFRDSLGKSAGWIRTAMETLVAEGLLDHDRLEGRYKILPPRLQIATAPAV